MPDVLLAPPEVGLPAAMLPSTLQKQDRHEKLALGRPEPKWLRILPPGMVLFLSTSGDGQASRGHVASDAPLKWERREALKAVQVQKCIP